MAYAKITRRQGESFTEFQARQRADSAARQLEMDAEQARIRRTEKIRRAYKPEPEISDFDYSMNS
jgi:hypothetical protein